MKAPGFWRGPQPTWLARALQPIGAIYGAATAARMSRSGARVAAPVICVGNFVAGGAGKTPTAIAVARMLQASGERVAFLSRGYGGAPRSAPLKVDPSLHSAAGVGDEPLLLARVAPCWIGPDRLASAEAAIESGATLLVMDDGLQNPSLAKDYAIAVVDGEAPFGNGLCLPAGPLRAPVEAQLPYVDALVVVGGGPVELAQIEARAPERPAFPARLQPAAVAAALLVGRPVLAFAGIARPEKFFDSLAAIGANVVAARAFADHHVYSPAQIEALMRVASSRNLLLVTTEKDHVRIPPSLAKSVLTLPVSLGFEDSRAISRSIVSAIARRRRAAV